MKHSERGLKTAKSDVKEDRNCKSYSIDQCCRYGDVLELVINFICGGIYVEEEVADGEEEENDCRADPNWSPKVGFLSN